jgi:hypothetical protein
MKANELRIGSLVLDRGGKILTIDRFYGNKIECDVKGMPDKDTLTSIPIYYHPLTEEIEYLQPIPLTEEWLIKFGFRKVSVCEYELSIKLEKFEDWWDYYKEEETSIYVILEDGIMVEVNKVGVKLKDEDLEVMSFKLPHIQNVHQLQNLFYSLTNEELICHT